MRNTFISIIISFWWLNVVINNISNGPAKSKMTRGGLFPQTKNFLWQLKAAKGLGERDPHHYPPEGE